MNFDKADKLTRGFVLVKAIITDVSKNIQDENR